MILYCDADDIVLMALSLNGLQKLIDILGKSIQNISPKINVKKSKYIIEKKIIKKIFLNFQSNYMMK